MTRAISKRPTSRRETNPRRKLSAIPTTPVMDVGDLRRTLGLTQAEFARVCGFSVRAVAGWEAGEALTVSSRKRLTEVQRLGTALGQLVPPKQLAQWLRSPQPAFDGQTPLHLIERGESDRIWHMIWQIESGVVS